MSSGRSKPAGSAGLPASSLGPLERPTPAARAVPCGATRGLAAGAAGLGATGGVVDAADGAPSSSRSSHVNQMLTSQLAQEDSISAFTTTLKAPDIWMALSPVPCLARTMIVATPGAWPLSTIAFLVVL